MGIRRITGFVAILLFIISLGLLLTKGLNFGLDFTGGTQIEARFAKEVAPVVLKQQLEGANIHGVRVQQYGSTKDLLIRVANPAQKKNAENDAEAEKKAGLNLKSVLQKLYPEIEIRRVEFVGSEVGEKLIEQGSIAVLVAILLTMLYIALRFEYRLALSAAVGLLHDAVLILGVFACFGFEFDLATLASVMAVLGYSLNDTIVVFDRIRENFRKVRKGSSLEIVNLSVNQTLSRTIMTSFMTLLVVLALLLFGGETLFGFSMAFFVGILVGTFSSIYVSGALALSLGLSRTDMLVKPKTVDDRP